MATRESRGSVKKKSCEPLVPVEERVKKRSKGPVKVKISRLSSPPKVAVKHGTNGGSKQGRVPGETMKPGMSQGMSALGSGGIKKEYLTSSSSCRLTFKLPKDAVGQARKVAIVGDFNKWDKEASPMHKLRNGDYEITVELPTGREYRFRYLIDGHRWENDWCADRYDRNPHGSDDSVVIV